MNEKLADISSMTFSELLLVKSAIEEELGHRGITRSANNLAGDLAEHLFCKAFEWKRLGNSEANFDAIGEDDKRYQIKGRRLIRRGSSRQLSAIRNLEGHHFAELAAVLFNKDYSIKRAALVPRSVVLARARYQKRTNSHVFHLQDKVWELPGVKDVTDDLMRVARKIDSAQKPRQFAGGESKLEPHDPFGALAGTVTIRDSAAMTAPSGERWAAEHS